MTDPAAAVSGAHAAVAQASALAADEAERKRLTYVMAFRVGLVTLLLAAALVAELGASTGENTSPVVTTLFALIAATYGLTIVFALALRSAPVNWLAAAQLGADSILTTMLVHLTGNAESAFVFMYILVIVGAAFVLPRAALPTAGAAVILYLGRRRARAKPAAAAAHSHAGGERGGLRGDGGAGGAPGRRAAPRR